MKRVDNPELDRLILDHLASKYKLRQKREGVHLSTIVYCLTRSFFQLMTPEVEPTDEEVMLFALGLGLQNELTPASATTPVHKKDGLIYSPDMVFELSQFTVELKTTRAGMKRYAEGEFPETWIEYIKGGCWVRNITSYNLSVLYLAERPMPKLKSETLIFEPEELTVNWKYLLDRKEIYNLSLITKKPPAPFCFCKMWECQYCKFYTTCQALNILTKEVQQDAT